MIKSLRIMVPVTQVLAVVAVFAWTKLSHDPRILVEYVYPARSLIVKESFPLVVAWAPIIYAAEWCGRFLPPANGVWFPLGLAVFGGVFLLSVALFWRFVVGEIEMRVRGESMLRFRNSRGEVLILMILFLTGTGAILYAYIDGESLLRLGRSKADAIIGGLFLVTWAIALIGISIHDLKWFLGKAATCELAHPLDPRD